jgi:Trypsin-co-occurring domain 2
MTNDNSIGLSELIKQVKRELLSPDLEDDVPLLSVDQVELELQVSVRKEGKAGIKIYVVEIGGGGNRDDVQTVKVMLSPLLSKEMLLGIYRKRHPDKVQELVEKSLEAMTKGSGDPVNQFD